MNGKKFVNKTLALVLALVLTVGLLPIQASAATADFSDVPANHWAYADVMRARSSGIVSGVGDNKFNPGGDVAYSEMIKMVVNAFFRDEYNAYEAANASTMHSYFGNQTYWFSNLAYYADQVGLLDYIELDIRDYAACVAPMNRYEMATLLYNAASKKNIDATIEQKNEAQENIKDYKDIPAMYKYVVTSCYAMGLLNGKGGKGFAGNDHMTRAEACAVIIRMDDLITNGNTGTNPEPTPEPTPTPSQPVVPSSGIKDISGNKYETAINALYAGGIITDADLTNGNFRPNDVMLTREDALIYYRLFSNMTRVNPRDLYPDGYYYNHIYYTKDLDTEVGWATVTLTSHNTGYSGSLMDAELNRIRSVRNMRIMMYNLTYYNTPSNGLWVPAYHGFGVPTTPHYDYLKAFENNLDPVRMASTDLQLGITRGEWCQVIYNLGITQANSIRTAKSTGGVISG